MSGPHEIRNPNAPYDGAPGWPRPYYVGERAYTEELGEPGKKRVNFVQYITAVPSEQIFHCSEDRTARCFYEFLCSNCADPLGKENPGWMDRRSGDPIGSGMCSRCLVFATTACPLFAKFDQHEKELYRLVHQRQLRWVDQSTGEVWITKSAIAPKRRYSIAEVREILRTIG